MKRRGWYGMNAQGRITMRSDAAGKIAHLLERFPDDEKTRVLATALLLVDGSRKAQLVLAALTTGAAAVSVREGS